ncbi:Nitrate transport protein NrtA [compost metagenome]
MNVIEQRFLGHYEDGLGNTWDDKHAMAFCKDCNVNFPWLSDGMWFMTQFKRWGLIKQDPDYAAVAAQVNQTKLFSEAASALGLPVPASQMRGSTLMDGKLWDGSNPVAYAQSFAIKV